MLGSLKPISGQMHIGNYYLHGGSGKSGVSETMSLVKKVLKIIFNENGKARNLRDDDSGILH